MVVYAAGSLLLCALPFVACSVLDGENLQNAAEQGENLLDGTSCQNSFACLGGTCLTEEEKGFPGGYCTTTDCVESGCAGLKSRCFATEGETKGEYETTCFRTCEVSGKCDRADEGYECVQKRGISVCLPPEVTDARKVGSIGASCERHGICKGEEGICLRSFPNGYCSKLPCESDDGCPGDGVCAPLSSGDGARKACLLPCKSNDECRDQYECAERGSTKVCVPADEGSEMDGPPNPDGKNDGKPCVSDLKCKGENCIREREFNEEGDVLYPEGYCSTTDCSGDDDCYGDAACVERARSSNCMATCSSDSDCRDGYQCLESEEGKNFCDTIYPESEEDDDGGDDPPEQPQGLDIQCQSGSTLNFSVPQGAQGFYIAPYAKDGTKIEPQTLTQPGGGTLNIPTDYSFLNLNTRILESYTPLLFPASDRSKFQGSFGGGDYSLAMNASGASELCYYVLPQNQPGVELKVRFYFVGVPNVSASNAGSNPDVQEIVGSMQSIYDSIGVNVNVSAYKSVSDSAEQRYSIIRNLDDVSNLLRESKSPGDSLKKKLTINLFMIRDFQVPSAPGLLGISSGLPGMIGLHGTKGSGLVFSASDLGSSNQSLGQTIAHEVGHFLGLRHTTERASRAHDPITDTPECMQNRLGPGCPDSGNFMFAYSLGASQTNFSQGQATVIKANPALRSTAE